MSQRLLQEPEYLTSWKEIAVYLGKGVRTVQRWERQLGLPVRRPNVRARGPVHTTRAELERWLEERWTRRSDDEHFPPNGHLPPDGHKASPVPDECMDTLRRGISRSAELRLANRELLHEIKGTVSAMFDECQNLIKGMTRLPPQQ